MANDLFEHAVDEALELRLGHGLHALCGEADRDAADRGFVERRIDHAVGAELVEQAERGAEHATVDADILAEHDDARIVFHFPGQGLRDCFDQGDLSHG